MPGPSDGFLGGSRSLPVFLLLWLLASPAAAAEAALSAAAVPPGAASTGVVSATAVEPVAVTAAGISPRWVIYPLPFPKERACDGFAWRAFYDELAFGLSLIARKRCVDPWSAEQFMEPQVTPDSAGSPPDARQLEALLSATGAQVALVPVLDDGPDDPGRQRFLDFASPAVPGGVPPWARPRAGVPPGGAGPVPPWVRAAFSNARRVPTSETIALGNGASLSVMSSSWTTYATLPDFMRRGWTVQGGPAAPGSLGPTATASGPAGPWSAGFPGAGVQPGVPPFSPPPFPPPAFPGPGFMPPVPTSPRLVVYRVSLGPDGKLGKPEELTTATLTCWDPVANAEALGSAVPRILAAVSPGRKMAKRPGAGYEKAMLPPVPLLDRLLARSNAFDAEKGGARALAALARDYLILGFYLSEAQLSRGYRLLIRGAALAQLALSFSDDDREVRLVSGLGLLLTRHTAQCKLVLEPLLRAKDPDAAALLAACEGRSEELLRQREFFLYRVAAGRSDRLTLLATRLDPLMAGGVPLAYLGAGVGREVGVGEARVLTALWLATEESEAAPHLDASTDVSRLVGAVSEWAGPMLRRRAAALPAPVADRPSPGQLERGGGSGAGSPSSKTGLAPGELPTPVLPGISAPAGRLAVLALEPGLVRGLREDMLALPAIEYAYVAQFSWGVPEEARAILDAAKEALPDCESLLQARADFRRWDRRGTYADWADNPSPGDPADPSSVPAFRIFWGRPCGKSEDGFSRFRLAWDLGSVAQKTLHDQFSRSLKAPDLENLETGTVDFELAVDPWDCWLRSRRLSRSTEKSAASSLVAQFDRARAECPECDQLLQLEATKLAQRSCPGSAVRLLEKAAADSPQPGAALRSLFKLYADGYLHGKAWKVVEQMVARTPPSLTQVHCACNVGFSLLNLGQVEAARPVVQFARETEQWMGYTLLLTAGFLIWDGHVEEGLEWYRRSEERYPSDNVTITGGVRALLASGHKVEAIRFAEGLGEKALANGDCLSELGRLFLAFGETERGLSYLRKRRDLGENQLTKRDCASLRDASMATNPVMSRDPAVLQSWMALAMREKELEYVEAVGGNPFPEAVDALLLGVRNPTIGPTCARKIAARGLIDLDLPASPTPADLQRAHAVLTKWWATARQGYLDTRVN